MSYVIQNLFFNSYRQLELRLAQLQRQRQLLEEKMQCSLEIEEKQQLQLQMLQNAIDALQYELRMHTADGPT